MSDENGFLKTFGFRLLGFAQARGGERRYVFEKGGELVVFRGTDLVSLPGLLLLNPNPRLWRRLFPKRGQRIDTAAAAGLLIHECALAGRIELPPALAPRPVGRPRKQPDNARTA